MYLGTNLWWYFLMDVSFRNSMIQLRTINFGWGGPLYTVNAFHLFFLFSVQYINENGVWVTVRGYNK